MMFDMMGEAAIKRAGMAASLLALTAWSAPQALAEATAAKTAQAQPAAAATVEDETPVIPAIAEWAEGYVTSGKLAGLVTLVAQGGEVTHLSSHGVQNLQTRVPMTQDTLFRIYSMTKPITSVGIMMLVEEGKIALDDPVAKYLPAFKGAKVFKAVKEDGTVETEKQKRAFTVRDLMRHTAGMTYGIFGNHPVDKLYREAGLLDPRDDNEAFLKKLATLPLMKQPGTDWHYSVSVDVQGRLIEVISGKTLGAFFQERIFDPLDMDDTGFFTPTEDLYRLATVYSPKEDEDGIVYNEQVNAAGIKLKGFKFMSGGGGLVSTAHDYLKFSQMMLNGGELNGVRLLKQETVDDMRRNHLPEDQLPYSQRAPGHGFGLGFAVTMEPQNAHQNKGRYFWGGAASTVFWIDPEDDTVAILMTQMNPSSTYPLREEFEKVVHPE
ncbi:MAG: serine hydrolase domain-containing protein [Alphaproteobacteria bacterium]